jgi:[acyl-carrier-protein] S-malonyltransferase
VLGYDLWRLVQEGPAERLNETEITQPAMLTAGYATWRLWQSAGGPDPDYMAGHSLGEYTALVAADAIDFGDAVALAAARGRAMKAATPPGTSEMAAILGLGEVELEQICAEAAQGEVVACANYNAPGQVVIAGHREAVARAVDKAREAGARRALPLPVSVASHCELMRPAAEAIRPLLADIEIRMPRVPVIHNADVQPAADAGTIRDALERQLWSPVRWTDTINWLLGNEVTRFAECGPGKVLTGLCRRISREVEATALVGWEVLIETNRDWS